MTNLEINIALANAMGWAKYNSQNLASAFKMENGYFYCWCGWYWREFDYHDPVIFVAICKRWRLDISHKYKRAHSNKGVFIDAGFGVIEKAAALCVIELAKRSIK